MTKAVRSLAVVVLAGLGLVTVTVLLVPKLFGWYAYVVTSGSMAPTFDAGAVVVAAPLDGDDVALRDIVTFRDPGGYTTHRVVGLKASSAAGIESQSFVTKGDANEEADPIALDPRNIVGKAQFAVPHLGYVIEFVKAPFGAGLLAALFLFVVFFGDKESKQDQMGTTKQTPEHETVAVR